MRKDYTKPRINLQFFLFDLEFGFEKQNESSPGEQDYAILDFCS